MALDEELSAALAAAAVFVTAGQELRGVVASEPSHGLRVYLCAYVEREELAWLALDSSGAPIGDRALVRDAVSIIAMCELAEESAGGGDVAAMRTRLSELRESEAPEGIEEAEEAAAALETIIVDGPRVASLAYLDAIGTAAARLERTLGERGSSPFAAAMRSGAGAIDQLTRDVERRYKFPFR